MAEAGFRALSTSGIADEYLGADKLLVEDIFRAMLAESHPSRECCDEIAPIGD